MIKFFKNNNNLIKSLYTLGVIILAIVFYRYTENIKISNFLPIIISVLSPFIYGSVMAYILNIGTRFLERKVFVKIKFFQKADAKVRRTERFLSIAIAFIVSIGAIIGIVSYIIPEIMSSVQNIINVAIGFDYSGIRRWVDNFLIQNHIVLGTDAYNSLIGTIDNIMATITDWIKYLPNMIGSVISHAIGFASSLIDVVMGFVIALYILADKEKIVAMGKKITRCLFPEKHSGVIISNVKMINNTFNSFFTGKTLDSLIIGIIFFLGAVILNLPYPLLFAIIIAITNMIPYFGPFIGAVPVTILTLLVSPIKSIWVVIFIIILQQFDGIILGPKILGESIGLKPIGVIFAIIVGGAIAGPLGMFFGVPLFACIFKLFFDFIDKTYLKKYPMEDKEEEEIVQSQES